MKNIYGSHRRRGRRRRLGKAVIISLLSVILLALSSLSARSIPETGQYDRPSKSQINYARKLCSLTGPVGEAKGYITRWPDYADYIMGLED